MQWLVESNFTENIKISLKDSEETQEFTSIFNSLFDALNRKHPKEGIRINRQDFKVFYNNTFI